MSEVIWTRRHQELLDEFRRKYKEWTDGVGSKDHPLPLQPDGLLLSVMMRRGIDDLDRDIKRSIDLNAEKEPE